MYAAMECWMSILVYIIRGRVWVRDRQCWRLKGVRLCYSASLELKGAQKQHKFYKFDKSLYFHT